MEQPLLLCSFANSPMTIPCGQQGSNCAFDVTGLFCALSQDDGTRRPPACSAKRSLLRCSQARLGLTCA